MTRQEIVTQARALLGTPYQHQGRLPGVGLDCMGVVIAVAHALGYATEFDFTAYGVEPDVRLTLPLLQQYLDRISIGSSGPGDVLFMRFTREPQHLALCSRLGDAMDGEESVIHSYMAAGGVVEHRLDEIWRERIVAAWRFRGID